MSDPGALASLPRDEGGPVFAEPWQAHAFAPAVELSEAGVCSWSEWAVALGAELAAASQRGEPDDGSRYYIVTQPRLLVREEEWAAAYRRMSRASR
jgi:nitrile hydratase accessory protein